MSFYHQQQNQQELEKKEILLKTPQSFINDLGSNMNFLGEPDVLIDLKKYLDFNDEFRLKFIQLGGIYSIQKILISLIKKMEFCNYEYIDCIMNIYDDLLKNNGILIFIDHKDILCTFGELITCSTKIIEPRRKALKILSKISLYSENGHEIIVEWYLNLYQKLHLEPIRFTHLITMLKIDTNQTFRSSCLKFLNSLLHFDRKMILEQELNELGLFEFVELLYFKKEKCSDKLKKEIEKIIRKDNSLNLNLKIEFNDLFKKNENSIDSLILIFKELNKIENLNDTKLNKILMEIKNISNEKEDNDDENKQMNNLIRINFMGFGEFGKEDEMNNHSLVSICAKKKSFKKLKIKKQNEIKKQRSESLNNGQKRNALRFQQSNKTLKSMDDIQKFEKKIEYLKKYGFKIKNIFKNDSSILEITLLKKMLNNDLIDLSNYDNPNNVATLFKQTLNGFIRFPSFLVDLDDEKVMKEKLLLSPDIKYIQMLFELLFVISKSSKINNMTSKDLSIIFAPILVDNSTDDTSQNVIWHMISDYPKIFDISNENLILLLQDSLGEKEILNENDSTISSKKIYKHGVQSKKNNLTHKWGKVYLSIQEEKLQTFSNVSDFKKGKKPSSTISLSYSVCDFEDRNGHPYCYSVFSHGKTTLFEAENEAERNEWVNIIKRLISKNIKSEF
eukprot:gene333-6747_t